MATHTACGQVNRPKCANWGPHAVTCVGDRLPQLAFVPPGLSLGPRPRFVVCDRPRFVVWGPAPKRVAYVPAGGCGGSGLAPPMPAVAERLGRNGAGAKRRRSEAHAEPGEVTCPR